MVSSSQCKCIFKNNSYLLELKDRIKLLIDIALECITKLATKIQRKVKLAKTEEQPDPEEEEEVEEDEWTDDEAIKIFMSLVKILQINFPLYKVHKIYSTVSIVLLIWWNSRGNIKLGEERIGIL